MTPVSGHAQSNKDRARQNDKNLMRNLGFGLGGVAIYEGIKGKTTNALIAGAGAAYAGKKYEDARKAQGHGSNEQRYGYPRPQYDGDEETYRPAPRETYCSRRDGGRDNGEHRGWSKRKHHRDDD